MGILLLRNRLAEYFLSAHHPNTENSNSFYFMFTTNQFQRPTLLQNWKKICLLCRHNHYTFLLQILESWSGGI